MEFLMVVAYVLILTANIVFAFSNPKPMGRLFNGLVAIFMILMGLFAINWGNLLN